MRGKKRSKK